jgi:hypothetical protein
MKPSNAAPNVNGHVFMWGWTRSKSPFDLCKSRCNASLHESHMNRSCGLFKLAQGLTNHAMPVTFILLFKALFQVGCYLLIDVLKNLTYSWYIVISASLAFSIAKLDISSSITATFTTALPIIIFK